MTDEQPSNGNGNGTRPVLRVGHCNVCGAVLAVKFAEGPIDPDDPMIRQHADWHRATFGAIDLALSVHEDVDEAAKALDRVRGEG